MIFYVEAHYITIFQRDIKGQCWFRDGTPFMFTLLLIILEPAFWNHFSATPDTQLCFPFNIWESIPSLATHCQKLLLPSSSSSVCLCVRSERGILFLQNSKGIVLGDFKIFLIPFPSEVQLPLPLAMWWIDLPLTFTKYLISSKIQFTPRREIGISECLIFKLNSRVNKFTIKNTEL